MKSQKGSTSAKETTLIEFILPSPYQIKTQYGLFLFSSKVKWKCHLHLKVFSDVFEPNRLKLRRSLIAIYNNFGFCIQLKHLRILCRKRSEMHVLASYHGIVNNHKKFNVTRCSSRLSSNLHTTQFKRSKAQSETTFGKKRFLFSAIYLFSYLCADIVKDGLVQFSKKSAV